MLQVKAVKSQSTKIYLNIQSKKAKLNPNCSITIVVVDQQQQKEVFTDTFYPPYGKNVQIGSLQPSKLYKVKYSIVNGNVNQTLNLFTFTKARDDEENQNNNLNRNDNRIHNNNQRYKASSTKKDSFGVTDYGLSNTQNLIKTVGRINNVMGKKQLDRAILAARYSKDTTDFVMSGHKSLKPQLRQDRLKRTMLISHGIQVTDTIYKHSQGRQLFKNDWFMGPFYCYDKNQKQMKKK